MNDEVLTELEAPRPNGGVLQQPAANPAAPETCELDANVLELLATYAQQAAACEGAKQGAIALFMRQRGLQGDWQIAPNGRSLVRRA